jgi:hypothetical protein
MLESTFSITCHLISNKCLMNEKARFKVALKRYLNTHSILLMNTSCVETDSSM